MAVWMGGEFRGEWIPVHVWLNPFSVHLKTITTLLVRYCCCCEVAQPCPTLCSPTDCSLPGSSVHGIFQTRILEWVAVSFSRGPSRPRDRTWVFHFVGRRFSEMPCKNVCCIRSIAVTRRVENESSEPSDQQ